MDVRLRMLAGRQEGLIATRQLVQAGWDTRTVHHWSRKEAWQKIHDGVWALGPAPCTQRQLWWAATLTAPGTWLNAFSAANVYGFHLSDLGYETVVRAGSGGPRRYPGLLVSRSSTLDGVVGHRDGIAIVSPVRALIEISASLRDGQRGRAFRESIRLRTTAADDIAKGLAGQRGTRALAALCDRYATLPYHRCRSDAESRALEVLHDAGIPIPLVNVRVHGPRPDFFWPGPRLIIEIDSREFHQFPDVDAANTARWEAARITVRRLPASQVYTRPARLIALYHSNVPILDP